MALYGNEIMQDRLPFPDQIHAEMQRERREKIVRQAEKTIWVTFRKKGLHRYPAAEQMDDVKYLSHPHRHLFWFRVGIQVFHNDRDIEFHQFLNWLESLYDSSSLQLDYKSCEMISDELYIKISEKFPGRFVEIEVSEDGECGSTIKYGQTDV
jgi:hypothetical protein